MDALLQSLQAAVEASPEDVALRLHFAELLIAAGDGEAAVRHLGHVLALEPSSTQARKPTPSPSVDREEQSGSAARLSPASVLAVPRARARLDERRHGTTQSAMVAFYATSGLCRISCFPKTRKRP